jgi:sporulation protein YlmC with PRC-barrel domain
MLIESKKLTNYTLDSLDKEIGKVKEYYFDDRYWTIRYLVVETGSWLADRKVLISPYALESVMMEDENIKVMLSKKQIEDSPSWQSDKPVSRQFEKYYYEYYGWPMYWGGFYSWGAYSYPTLAATNGLQKEAVQGDNPYASETMPNVMRHPERNTSGNSVQNEKTWDPCLRSTHAVIGHDIQAKDGKIGHVDDFIIDDETWAIRYLVVSTRNWWPGKKVLVSPRWIEGVSWDESKVFVNLSRETIQRSPEYTDTSLLTREYEAILYGHYDQKGYWVDELQPAKVTEAKVCDNDDSSS